MRELTLGESECLARLAGEFGTPLYAYDAACIKSQFRRLSEAFSGSEAEIRYAMKALPNPAVLSLLGTLGSGVDAVSLGELRLALRAGIPKERISFTPSLAPLTDIQAALELGVHVTLDSLSLLEKFGRIVGPGVPCSLRINPHIKAGANEKVQTGHRESKFGISIEQIDETLQVVAESGITVTGLHVHTGSDVAEPEIFLQSADVLFRAADKFKDVEIFDLGGGFKVSYHFGSHDADVEKIGANCARVRDEYISRSGRKARIWLEPGKFLVSAAGFLVVKANIVKKTPYAVFVGVDSGLNHLIRPMFYGAYHEIENLSNPAGIKQPYNVVGNICETDTFATQREISEVREGDLLVFRNAGAYGFSMSSQFNSHPRPAEVLFENGSHQLIRRRETFDDLLTALV